jgi:Phosphoenolpyruvate synthase/pyruvate phosphate dikinase
MEEKKGGLLDPFSIEFTNPSFDKLMQRRIHKVLLICSSYDAFILEEDGRIEEQIFKDYVSLNLRFPPSFTRVCSGQEALALLKKESFDLIISMLNIGEVDIFKLAHTFKEIDPFTPVVVLTHFSREVSLKLEKEDLSAIDYVFCWLGNADLLLAIIKLIEDKMNADNDLLEIGVQAIILVEDSVRYYSSYLPTLYKVILNQSRNFIHEAVNEQQQNLRMRGRPKILLATTYDEAMELYTKYKNNLLGIVSDVSFKVHHRRDSKTKAGITLCEVIRKDDPYMPFIFQSSDLNNKAIADELNTGFIHKYSKSLSHELVDYVRAYFFFGNFQFINPTTNEVVFEANNLKTLRCAILSIPDESLYYHASHNHLSKWLFARALFSIAYVFRSIQASDFSSIISMRGYIADAIVQYRQLTGRGVIGKFNRNDYNEYLQISRIGEGSMGGKARGLAFINSILKRYNLFNKYENVVINIPRTTVISTEYFDRFMEDNKLYQYELLEESDQNILRRFIDAKLSDELVKDLREYVSNVTNPIAVRSSSKLEDSYYQPFAGIYSTYMIPRVEDDEQCLGMLMQAIKSVYASVFYSSSRGYIFATSNVLDEEKMGVVLQEVCGTKHENLYYPTFSGVARSINFYPLGDESSHDGIASIAFGLGKFIVDGGITMRFSPKHPTHLLQMSTPQMALRDTQKMFYALDLNPEAFTISTDDGVNLKRLDIDTKSNYEGMQHVASVYDAQDDRIRDYYQPTGRRVISFASILKYGSFPLAEILDELLTLCQKEMNSPIEIEFAVNFDVEPGQPKIFNFLQIRPIVENEEMEDLQIEQMCSDDALIFSNSALGHGMIEGIKDIVYVKPEEFNSSYTRQIAEDLEKINRSFKEKGENYVLVGPGRWGSSDPWLGIPVKWPQISEARLIVECGLKNFRVDPSQGTHFFQNLTSFRVGYFTINPYMNDGKFDVLALDSMPAAFENEYIRRVTLENPLTIIIDGRNNKGIVSL